ncbi:MAG: HAD family hydrolase [Bacteroidia bacterium]|nr:HAD family hydrolase [Bacteroidia bacterium]
MNPASLHTLLNEHNIKVLLTDFFDTIVHRIVHPNYTQRLWAKILIREFGLKGSIDSLYFTRRESSLHLKKRLGLHEVEIPYEALKLEVFNRLVNNLIIEPDQKDQFLKFFELADLKSEQAVQFLNTEVVQLLQEAKSEGLKIYIVSDFYGPKPLFKKLLKHHGIQDLFDGVYSSSSSQASKFQGTIYDQILNDLNISPGQIVMIGDNKRCDFQKAKDKGLHASLLPHQKFLLKNKLKSVGNDKRDYDKVIDKTYKACRRKEAPPYSEYIILFQVFIERLYIISRRFNIKNLFFASREGLYLKKLFDLYQEQSFLAPDDRIGTHYLRMSRQAAFQITYEPLHKEEFSYMRKRFRALSIEKFIQNFAFDKEIEANILFELKATKPKEAVDGFFDSDDFSQLMNLPLFQQAYEQNRKNQKKAFLAYLSSFEVDVDSEGINIVDVGWGGTMQEAIFKVFEEKIPVTGYYLGLRENYNIQEMTKRYGLLFSIHPYEVYSDHILTANTQLYEQLLSANHGSILGYDETAENFTLENYKQEEKELFENHLMAHQEFMLNRFKILLKDLDLICYDYSIVQNKITDLALRTGLFQNKKKLNFISILNRGFIQNVGANKVGMVYNPAKAGDLKTLIKEFLIQPEAKFRYIAKLKSLLYGKKRIYAYLLPMRLVYWYFLFNRFVREKILKRRFFLKYNYFR